MTHYTVGIIVPPKTRKIKEYIVGQMAPYDESLAWGRNLANPKARWDWYRIGGRWDGWITDNEQPSDNGFNFGKRHETVENNITTTEAALKRHKIPHAIITPNGKWHDRGDLWMFGLADKECQKMHAKMSGLLRKYPGHRIVILDAHI
jgi:hypothetical protein